MTIETADYPGQFTFYNMKCAEHGENATCALHDWEGKGMVFLCDKCLEELRDAIAEITGEESDAKPE